MRPIVFAITVLLTLAIDIGFAEAGSGSLPEIGSSAQNLLTPAQQAYYGAVMLAQLRHQGLVMDDRLLTTWLQDIGNRLQSHTNRPEQPFTLFLVRDREINAFATLGGYVAVNAGLLLTAQNEDELAAVLSHEMAHVTQHHVLRSVERAQRDQLPVLLGLVAMIAAAQQSHSTSRGDATMAGISSAFGLLQQRQINYTRANEAEADRIGIRTLADSGYNPNAMPAFFERLQWSARADDGSEQVPEYLRSHPLTSTRISEAKARAAQLMAASSTFEQASQAFKSFTQTNDPLLPDHLQLTSGAPLIPAANDQGFTWAKERVRVLTNPTPSDSIHEYDAIAQHNAGKLTPAQTYGLAVARVLGQTQMTEAVAQLKSLSQTYPNNRWINVTLAQAFERTGNPTAADAQFEALLHQTPCQPDITLLYAELLNARATQAGGRHATQLLRPLIPQFDQDVAFIDTYARACELAGDMDLASEAHAQAAYLQGYPEQALLQLQALKRRHLDYTLRARVQARIAAITPEVLELRQHGLGDAQTPQ